ncbi:MAG: peptidylprolyl isomerase [Weeksellaceae bacterium]|nr:peptidylprolyl isomerase [Weeksellaceae bacterium]
MKLLFSKISLLLLFTYTAIAQPLGQEFKVDGVAAVVGTEVVLESDIQRDFMLAQQEGMEFPDHCSFVDNVLLQKMVLHHAKSDTLIQVSTERAKVRADEVLENFRSRATEEELFAVYGVRTMAELRTEIELLILDNEYTTEKRGSIERGIDASPLEVTTFYNEHRHELPRINEEVELSHIIIHPQITEEHENRLLQQLRDLRQEILEGASFATKAILYSEDPGSNTNGGLYKNIRRGTFVPEFDAVAFNLDEGEVSEPVQTEFGYHIIQLERRLGQAIDVRHILLQHKPTPEEIATAKRKLEDLTQRIESEEITFREAARDNSVDKYTRFNAGALTNQQTGEDRFERSRLPMKQVYALAGLKEGQISEPYESEYNRKPSVEILLLRKIIPAHQVDLEQDYTKIKNMVIQQKRQEQLYDWIRRELPNTFVQVNENYQHCNFELNWLKN